MSALKLYTLRNSDALSDNALIWCPRLDQWTAYKDARREHTREIAEEMQKCQRKARYANPNPNPHSSSHPNPNPDPTPHFSSTPTPNPNPNPNPNPHQVDWHALLAKQAC